MLIHNPNFSYLNPTNQNKDTFNKTSQLTSKFISYQKQFHTNTSQIRSSLSQINDSIINYKTEIKKLEAFLETINLHEKNYKQIHLKFEEIIKHIEHTIEIEHIITQLSTNQQIININEYITLYKRVKSIITFFKESKFQDKEDYIQSLIKLMYKGFKVYQDAFYVLLKRYDQLKSLSNNNNNHNEMKELLTKIQNISQCLQDEEINFDFSNNLIKERINKLLTIIKDANVISFSNKEQITSYSKGEGNTSKILTLVSHLIYNEEEYINTIILSSSNNTSKNNINVKIIKNIITPLIEKVILSLKDLIATQKKYDVSNITSISYDFYHHLDIMNSWIENTETIYTNILQKYHLNDMLNTITDSIQNINEFCVYYVNNYYKGISILNNEKIENENILTITSNTIYFIENIISFSSIQQRIYSNNNNLSNVSFVLNLIQSLENKANVLDKKYPPLHYIFLMNNVQLIYSKMQKSEMLTNEFSEEVLNDIEMKLKKYLNEYLKVSWMKVEEITFDDRDVIAYEKDNKTLKQTSKDLIKQKFSVFNDAMKINLKFQQNVQIVDRDLEKRIIEANIECIVNRYMGVFEKYGGVVFTKFKEKYMVYTSQEDVEQDLKLYFMPI